jgi:hypothetical protein
VINAGAAPGAVHKLLTHVAGEVHCAVQLHAAPLAKGALQLPVPIPLLQ